MGAQGTTTIDFGSFPGKTDASVDVTGQTGILSGSLVEAWIYPIATSDHSADEHMVDLPSVVAGTIVAGTGFTIYGFCRDTVEVGNQKNDTPRVYGQWTVAWVWN